MFDADDCTEDYFMKCEQLMGLMSTFKLQSNTLHHGCGCLLLQVFASACRHSLFTPAKEMVYISMTTTEMKEAKAVVDLLGNQVGRMMTKA